MCDCDRRAGAEGLELASHTYTSSHFLKLSALTTYREGSDSVFPLAAVIWLFPPLFQSVSLTANFSQKGETDLPFFSHTLLHLFLHLKLKLLLYCPP